MQTGDIASPNRSASLKRDGSNKYANPNPNSYLKSRRLPAKQQRRGEILSLLDSSLDDVTYELPDFSNIQGPFVHLSQSTHKRKSKSKKAISPSSYHGTTSIKERTSPFRRESVHDAASLPSLADDQNAPMEEVLRALHTSSLTDSDSTSCTDMTSFASIGFDTSSQHTSSFASLLGDGDDIGVIENGLDCVGEQDESCSCANGNNRKGGGEGLELSPAELPRHQCLCEENMSAIRERARIDSSLDDEISESSASYYEEVCSDSEEANAEEHSHGDDEILYDEIIVDDPAIGDEFVEELYFSDEEIIEEFIEDSEDYFEEYIIEEEEYQDSKFEATLGIIEEEDDDQSDSDQSHSSNQPLHYALEEELFSEKEDTEDMLYDVIDEESVFGEYSFTSHDDDESYIEEEIIPQFETPFVPAIVAWQEQEEVRALVEDEDPPEIAPRTPRNILMAVLAAAATDFKLRKVPKDHKKRFLPVSELAACLARLTKLNEHVVESMGRASPHKNEDDWHPSGAPVTLIRSLNLRIVTEAAAMGRVMRLKEKVFTNYEEPKRFFGNESKIDIEDLVDDKGYRILRTSLLVPLHEQDLMQESMSRNWNLGILEASTEADETTVENVKLPTERVPRFTKPPSCSPVMSRQEIHDSIARGVAEGAWDRKYRLERPHIGLRITSACTCQYCENPSAFQTHAYKKLSRQEPGPQIMN